MTTATIQVLRPNATREEALRTFSARGLAQLFWTLRSGSLRRIADVYVPFWSYQARYQMNRSVRQGLFALDAVDGSLDLFTFPQLPAAEDLELVETRNFLAPALSD